MQVLRSIAAVVAGFGFMASTVMVGTIVATVLFVPGGLAIAQGGVAPASVPPLFLAANLAVSFLGAVFGGWLAARIGASAPFGHAVVLAVLTGALSVVSAIAARSNSE